MLKYKLVRSLRTLIFFVLCLGVLCISNQAWAKYEVNSTTVQTNVAFGKTPIQWDWDNNGVIQISWNSTIGTPSGSDNLIKFVYLWSEVDDKLSDSQFNATTNDGEVRVEDAGTGSQSPVTGNSTLFQSKGYNDEDSIVYLHVKTKYRSGVDEELSEDVVLGPINIDNIAPTGTVQLVNDEGTSVNATSSSLIDLQMQASVNPTTCYIQETSTPAPDPELDSGQAYNATIKNYNISGDAGEKTVYVWFEDTAGNISKNPASDTFNLLESIYISPYEATIDLSKSKTKDFYISGAQENYNWTVTNSSVANISSGKTNSTEITLEGIKAGTCQLEASPFDGSGNTLTSGTIKVEQGYKKGDANGDGNVNIFDGVLFVNYLLGKNTMDDIKGDFDLNDDGEVNIFDGVKFVNFLLGKTNL